jgi:hypothetical protein
MSITLNEISQILSNHQNDESKLKSLGIFAKFFKITSIDDLNCVTSSFDNKTLAFNLLFSLNMLNGIETQHLHFFGFLTNSKILNDKAEMDTLKNVLKTSPDMIVDILNFIAGTGKSDNQKLELVMTVVESSDIFVKLVEEIGPNDVAKLFSNYFVEYEGYYKCCAAIGIDVALCEQYRSKIIEDNDTITFFGEQKLRYSHMLRGKYYVFEKDIGDNKVLIFNIRKRATAGKTYLTSDQQDITLYTEKCISDKTDGRIFVDEAFKIC